MKSESAGGWWSPKVQCDGMTGGWWVVVVKGVAVSKGLFYFIFKIKGILDIFKR